MAGYYLSTIDDAAWTRVTTEPTLEEGRLLAEAILPDLAAFLEEYGADPARWPQDREALARVIVDRLRAPDWYSDQSYENALLWDQIVRSFESTPGEQMGLDFRLYDYESIYWDCAEFAEKHGAAMMAESVFGSSAFRYCGTPAPRDVVYPMYSIFGADRVRELHRQLQAVEPRFAALPEEGDGSLREQFFEGLLPPVVDAVQHRRALWVTTDT